MSKHLAGFTVFLCVCARAPAEIYCNGGGEAVCKLQALRTD